MTVTEPPPPPPVSVPVPVPPAVSPMRRRLFNALGITSFVVGTIGIALPLLPTVPFYILAAFLFGKGNPAFERRLLDHPRFGPPIRAWRERGAISRRGKAGAITMLAGSGVMGVIFLPAPWAYVPAGVAVVCGTWIATRP